MKKRRLLPAASLLAIGLFSMACSDPGAPAVAPERAATSASAAATATGSAALSAAPSASGSAEATPSALASAEAAPSANASAAPSAAPSASPSASPVVKGFSFPSPKSGILTPAEADKLLANGARARVRLLDPGKEPLAKVAYAPTKGDSSPLRLDFTMKIAITAAGQATPGIIVPPQAVDVDMTTEDVDDSSGALVAMLLRKITIAPKDGIDQETADTLTKQLEGVRGYALRERVSAHGAASDFKVEVPESGPKGAEQLLATLNTTFRGMIPPLPEEPIGTGAKWQVLSRDDSSGTSLVELDDYTLKDRSGSRLTLDLQGRQLAASDKIKLPTGVPEGVSTTLAKFSTTLSGSLVIDTKQMGPVKGRSTHDSKLTIDVAAPGQSKVKADVTLKTNVVIGKRAGGSSAPSASGSASASATAAPTTAPAPQETKP